MQSKREFLTGAGMVLAAAAATPALAQGASMAMKKKSASDDGEGMRKPLPNRTAKTIKLFKAPGVWPNALASSPQGLWIAQQHLTDGEAKGAGVAMVPGKEQVWLVDMNGNVLKTMESNASNTSGLAYGNGDLYVCSNTDDAASGIHKVNVASGQEVAQLQLPLSPNNRMGGCHGAKWDSHGKLWVANNRMRSLMRMDPVTWKADLQIPIYAPPGMGRFHDFTFDKDGTILQVIANEGSKSHADNIAGLVRMEAETGKPLETITFVPGSCDPHGLDFINGQLVACDAGYHPGWANYDSPSSQYVFRIDLV